MPFSPVFQNPFPGIRQAINKKTEIPLGLLLVTQTFSILMSPSLRDQWSFNSLIFSAAILITLVLSIGPLTRSKPGVRLTIEIAGFGMLALGVLTEVTDAPQQQIYASIGFTLLFHLSIMVMLLAHLFSKVSQREKLLTALNFYLLTGISFSYLYLMINMASPGSFSIVVVEDLSSWTDYLYFSFVTLTTLGYGDILPQSNLAQSVTSIEAIIGVLSPTVMIARFVSTDR